MGNLTAENLQNIRSFSDCSDLKLCLLVRRQWHCSKTGIAPEMLKKIMQVLKVGKEKTPKIKMKII